jgi:hypothetical protein
VSAVVEVESGIKVIDVQQQENAEQLVSVANLILKAVHHDEVIVL